MGQQHLTEQRFSSLELDPRLLQALERLEFNFCTPIQAKSLPLLLAGKDVSGQAQTGTGKTLAFLLACAQRLLTSEQPATEAGKPRTLILAPTRDVLLDGILERVQIEAEDVAQPVDFRVDVSGHGDVDEHERAARP